MKKTTLGIKIGFAFFVLLLIFGVAGTNIYYSVSDGMITLEQIKEDALLHIKAGNLRFKVTKVLMATNDYIITNKEYYKQEYQKQNALLEKNYQEFIQSGLTDKEKQLAYEIRINIDSIQIYSERIFSITNPRQSSYAWELMEIMDYGFGNDINAKTTLIFDGISERIEENHTNAEMAKQKINTLIEYTILISLIFSLIIIYLIIVRSTHPIRKITESANLIAKGDYAKRLEITTHDEISTLADSFNQMAESIQQSQKALEDSKRLTEAIVSTAPVGLLVYDSEGKIISANNSFCNIFNLVQNPQLYQNIESMLEELRVTEEFRNHILKREPVSDVECSYSNPVKGLRIVNLTLREIQITDGESLLVIEDITERKHDELELIKAKEKAEESDKLKTAFINNISHEVRTPLNGILGFGRLLAGSELSEEERSEFFEQVEKSSNRLMDTVTDYMDMAMLFSNSMKVNIKEFVLEPVFKTITEKTKQLCSDKKIDFEVEIPIESAGLTVNSDPELIQKILGKLLDNAIKFTKEGSITCCYKIKTKHIEFFVKDTGRGIDSDKLDLIFEMFSQADTSMTRGYEGSGLGLTIANGLVTLLGGEMHTTSEKGKGSVFSFTIPLKNSGKSISPDAIDITKPKSTKKPLILIAEDDESNYKYLAVVLKSAGHNHIHAVNGKEAVDYCRENPDISIVLMDIRMPVMNGVEATKQIREFRPELPIIAITAHAQTGDEHRFLEAGCNDYISKPFKKEEFLSLIRKYVE